MRVRDVVRVFTAAACCLAVACAAPAKIPSRIPPPARSAGALPDVAPSANGLVRIFFATDRARADRRGEPIQYGAARSTGGALALGTCDVSIPRDHRMGKLERPSLWKLQLKEDRAKHIVIEQVEQRSYEDFYDQVRERASASAHPAVLVFVHGFDVSFQDAALRTAQLSYDLGFAGAPIVYSWPSEGALSGYMVDGTNAEWTAPHLSWFLRDVAHKAGAEEIHVIAHSMGNRALLRATERLANDHSLRQPLLTQAILMAPDVDADVFVQLEGNLRNVARHVTLYASSNDEALKLSMRLNGYRRAGDVSQGILLIHGVDSIDVSAVDTSMIGHSYYGERRSVLSDVFYLLRGMSASERSGLQLVAATPVGYYRFLP